MKYREIIKNKEINAYLKKGNENLGQLGFTDHSQEHCVQVAHQAGKILERFGYSEHEIELVKIAGYMHDIGNCVNRVDHAHSGAILSYNLLKDMGMNVKERTEIMMAIGNHDENTGTAISDISAALILADKSDVARSRVSKTNIATFDIHDKVNYAVTNAELKLDAETKVISLKLDIDTKICPVLDYFKIFMDRTIMSKYAAKYLKIWYELIINNTKLL